MTDQADPHDKAIRILLEALTTISYLKGGDGRASAIAEYALDRYGKIIREAEAGRRPDGGAVSPIRNGRRPSRAFPAVIPKRTAASTADATNGAMSIADRRPVAWRGEGAGRATKNLIFDPFLLLTASNRAGGSQRAIKRLAWPCGGRVLQRNRRTWYRPPGGRCGWRRPGCNRNLPAGAGGSGLRWSTRRSLPVPYPIARRDCGAGSRRWPGCGKNHLPVG